MQNGSWIESIIGCVCTEHESLTMIDEWHDNNSNALTSYSRRKLQTRVLAKQRNVTAPTTSHSVQFCPHNAGFIQMVLSPDFFGCRMRFTPGNHWTVCVQDSVKKSNNHIYLCTWPIGTTEFTFHWTCTVGVIKYEITENLLELNKMLAYYYYYYYLATL